LYLRNDKKYRHICSTKNKGGYLPCAAVPSILAYLSSAVYTGWIKASLVQFCNLNFFDNFWTLLPYISETTENLGTQLIPEIKAVSPLCDCAIYTGVSFLRLIHGGPKPNWYNFVFFAIRSFVSDIWGET